LEYLRAEFDRPDLKRGSRLPSARQIASRLDVSVPTVLRVFQTLAQQGRIRTAVGSGTYLVGLHPKRAEGLTFGLSLPFSTAAAKQERWGTRIYGGILQAAYHATPPVSLKPVGKQDDETRLSAQKLSEEVLQVDGLILFPSSQSDKIRAACEGKRRPVVDLITPSESATANFVSVDYFAISHQVARAWSATGRQRILLMLSAPLDQSVTNRLHLAGLVNGLGGNSNARCGWREVIAGSETEDGYRAMRDLLTNGDWIPDAVFCVGDFLALGALMALKERSMAVPETVSVVGATGLDLSTTEWPQLTRARQPFEQLGKELVEMLSRRLEQDGDSLPGRVLPAPWIGGATTRPAENELLNLSRRDLH
jgi:DNA-binding LacI/PurR family transcriptional regulator